MERANAVNVSIQESNRTYRTYGIARPMGNGAIPMKTAAIVNPFSGRRKAGKLWPLLLQSAGTSGRMVDTFPSEYPGHSETIAARVRRSGYDRVVVVGGDGTLSEVLNGLMLEEHGRMPSLGMVPFGTGCDYIRNFDVGAGRAARLKTALGESIVGASLGRCTYRVRDGVRQRFFAMVLGVGFDAEVIRRFKDSRLRSGWLSYAMSAIAGIGKLRPLSIKGFIDGSPVHADAFFFGAALGCCFGKGIRIAPDASPGAGRFEFVLAAPVSRSSLLRLICRAYLGLDDKSRAIRRINGSRAELELSPPAGIEADGEVLGETSAVRMEIIPDAFRFAAKGFRLSASSRKG